MSKVAIEDVKSKVTIQDARASQFAYVWSIDSSIAAARAWNAPSTHGSLYGASRQPCRSPPGQISRATGTGRGAIPDFCNKIGTNSPYGADARNVSLESRPAVATPSGGR
jgi:hypothetical protein